MKEIEKTYFISLLEILEKFKIVGDVDTYEISIVDGFEGIKIKVKIDI